MQINSKLLPVRPIIDAGMPRNISSEDKLKLEAKWNAAAESRRVAIEQETQTPGTACKIVSFELRRFGNKWQAYIKKDKRWVSLMPSVSLASSALDAMVICAEDEVFNR